MTSAKTVGPAPADFKGEFRAINTLSNGIDRTIEPVGPSFLAYARRKRLGRTFSEDERAQAASKVKKVEEEDDGLISEPEDPMMLQRDAKDWRGQDHYAVLGLSKLRYRATDEQIKRATRKKVLKHHPDKKAAAGLTENDSFFKCIQRANEILTDPTRRRQFDSVDEAADVEPPSKKDITKPSQFYKKWRPVFESEGRFSNIQPVPKLGDENSTRAEVEEFYDFFYHFDSWRSFEYLDEDVPDDNADRDHKRHIERKNNNARRKRKTEDTARLRHVVDDCLAMDARIAQFKKAEKASKNKKRDELEAKAKAEAEAKKKAAEEEAKLKEEQAAKAKVEKETGKKAKEAAKNAAKKNKRAVRGSVKDVEYFGGGASEIDAMLADVDLVISKIDVDELAELTKKLELAGKDGDKVKDAFMEETKGLVSGGKAMGSDWRYFKEA